MKRAALNNSSDLAVMNLLIKFPFLPPVENYGGSFSSCALTSSFVLVCPLTSLSLS
uniref:Uncharacterized protein n=1 Tax=Anguilla anguilla TaxID=7936 RepID=A0A0E9WX34_ANGAN